MPPSRHAVLHLTPCRGGRGRVGGILGDVRGLPRFEEVARLRPVDLLAPGAVDLDLAGAGRGQVPAQAPYVALVADVGGTAELALGSGPGAHVGVAATLADGRTWLRVGDRIVRSRRHGRPRGAVDALALTLTGDQATLFTRTGGTWTARARTELSAHGLDPYDDAWLEGLEASGTGSITRLRAGGFGQLGLRDLRLVTDAEGAAYRPSGLGASSVLLSATSAGPGFFGTAHASVWELDTDTLSLTHRSDLFFRRDGRVYGDHAIHLVRDGEDWLVATSTWGDFRDPAIDHVHAELGRTRADLLGGRHVVDTQPLRLPTAGLRSVGVWDPHLVRTTEAGGPTWLVGYVSARRYFDFHPALATGPTLEALTLRAAVGDRRATEGTTLARVDDEWRVLASDGRDNRRRHRAAYPVFDLDLRQLGTLEAPYPTNLPWPTLVPDGRSGSLLVAFDGTRLGGRLTGYGTHGAVVIARGISD